MSPEKQAEYETWLTRKYGPEIEGRISQSRKKMASMTDDERAAHMKELAAIEQALAESMRRGTPPQAAALDALIERHRAWVASTWGKECPPNAYAGLADNYEDPDFKARYEAIGKGFSEYLCTAMRSWAKRQH